MTVSPTPISHQFTLNAIHVGSKLYTVLVHHARANPGKTIFYGDLLAQARALYPEDAEVARAVPIGIGMKLLFVEAFCKANAYPNLACLVVNKGKHMPGLAYPGDWEREMREVSAFDWAAVQPVLDAFVSEAIVVATPLRRMREAAAREHLYEHYRAHRSAYAKFNDDDREEMVNILMTGEKVERALAMVLETKAALA